MPSSQPFRSLRRREVALGGAGFLGAFLMALLWPAGARLEQPIRFNHEKHVAAGAQCADCHALYKSSSWAGLPQIELCLTCHEQPLTESREEEKLRELASGAFPRQSHRSPFSRSSTAVF